MQYTIEVNGAKRSVDVDGETPLLWVLRDTLDLKGTKFGCGAAQRNVSMTLIHRVPHLGSILRRLPSGFGLDELVGTEVFPLRRRTAVGRTPT
jgi:hypothetical protein